jgi:predicted O-methyltransferase YrrM
MSKLILKMTENLYDYIMEVSIRENDVLKRLEEETLKDPIAEFIIIPQEEVQLLQFLVKLIGAQKTIDIGTYTGCSALAVAQAMPEDSLTITCDVNTETTKTAMRFWKEAGVEHKINSIIAPALETLDNLIAAGESGTFDFVFIDADKGNYLNYYEKSLVLLRKGGLIVVDNVLWFGNVANPEAQDDDTKAIRRLNEQLKDDTRVDISLLPMADGITLVRKR